MNNIGNSVREATPLDQALQSLRSAHERMSMQIDRTESAFRVALRPEAPSNGATAVKGPTSSDGELVDMLNSAATFMHNQADRLQAICDRSAI